MHDIAHLLELPWVSWAIFYSVLQAVFFWAVASTVQVWLRHARAKVRYTAACIAFAVSVTMIVLTMGFVIYHWGDLSVRPAFLPSGQLDLLKVPRVAWAGWLRPIGGLLPYVAAIWLICGVGRLLWLLISIGLSRIIVRRGRRICQTLVPSWGRLVNVLTPGRAVSIVETAAVRSPATLGWISPVILLPPGYAEHASSTDLDVVAAHELAHIRRQDYLFSVCQSCLEGLLFFNVGVWLLGRAVRHRRESCCDELAVAALGIDYKVYIDTIYRLARSGSPGPTLGATGGSLLERFRYLRAYPAPPVHSPWLLRTTCGVLVAMIALGAASGSVVREAASVHSVDLLRQADCGQTIYAILGVERRHNPRFLDDMQAAVTELEHLGQISPATAVFIAEDCNAGLCNDALLNASLPYYTAASLIPRKDAPWKGGGRRQWQQVAKALYEHSQTENDARRRTQARAAILIAAQESINGGCGYLRVLASDRRCLDSAGISDDSARRIWSAISVAEDDYQQSMLKLDTWFAGHPSVLSADLITIARSRPALQFAICNKVTVTKRRDLAQFSLLRESLLKSDFQLMEPLFR